MGFADEADNPATAAALQRAASRLPIDSKPRKTEHVTPLPSRVSRFPSLNLSACALAFALLTACSGTFLGMGGPQFSSDAEVNYQRGVRALDHKNWADATTYFKHVKDNFTFSQYATLSELGIADANLGNEQYSDAIDGYRDFIKSHPTHEKVRDGYAAFRIGEAYYREIPSSWFLVPPAFEKDQGPVHDAVRELAAFVVRYPDSEYAESARRLEADCVRRLAEHELYVAEFYLKRKKPRAASGRLEGLSQGTFLPRLDEDSTHQLEQVAHDYLTKSLEARVLLLLGRTYLELHQRDQAKQTFERLVSEHQGDEGQSKDTRKATEAAKEQLAHMAREEGAAKK